MRYITSSPRESGDLVATSHHKTFMNDTILQDPRLRGDMKGAQ